MEPSKELEINYSFFETVKDSLIDQGKEGLFALIKDEQLIGTLPTEKEAYEEGVTKFGTGVFLVQKITKEPLSESIQFLYHVSLQ